MVSMSRVMIALPKRRAWMPSAPGCTNGIIGILSQCGTRLGDGGRPPLWSTSPPSPTLWLAILAPMDTDTNRIKRRRSPSVDSSSSEGSSFSDTADLRSPSPPPKYHRGTLPVHLPFACNLPPTCSQPDTSTSYATEGELERHQEIFHRWVCHVPIKDRTHTVPLNGIPESFVSRRGKDWEFKECGKVFPDEWLLNLVSLFTMTRGSHQSEG